MVHDGLARGLRESTKALTRGEALLVVLVSSVTEANIIKLVEGLANDPENKVPLIKVADAKQLGEWAGLGKICLLYTSNYGRAEEPFQRAVYQIILPRMLNP